MLAIKLQRIGKKHQPSYRLVVAEKRSKLGAPPVEDLGSYNPFTKKGTFKKERISHWLKVGARPTATTHNLLVKEGIIDGPKVKIHIKGKAKSIEAAAPAGQKEEAPKTETAEAAAPEAEPAAPETPGS